MSARPLMIASLLGASIGVPYVVSHTSSKPAATGTNAASHVSSSGETSGNRWSWPSFAPANTGTATQPSPPFAAAAPATAYGAGLGPSGTASSPDVRLHPVEQVLRFDLTREWVYQNWDRKWTGPTDVGLTAVRVSLVSGTDVSSLAGALTYFFNAAGEIEHISFHGRTGNPARLVDFLTRNYEFAPAAAPTGEQVYQVSTWNGKVQSELRTRPEALVRNSTPLGSTVVELELARPGSKRYLPPREPKLQIPAAGG